MKNEKELDNGLEVVGDNSKKEDASTKPAISGDTITIEKTEFQALMDRINRLEAAGDKKQLARYDSAHREETEQIVKLLEIDGKIVKSWGKMKDNFVDKNDKGWWEEKQTMDVIFMDNSTKSYRYIDFAKSYVYVPAKVINETKNEERIKDYKGQTVSKYLDVILEVKTLKDGTDYTINSVFVN